MRLRITLFCAVVCLLAVTVAVAQDAAKVDPKHYKVEAENDQVRVLRVHYGPGEKSVMHSHPGQVVVYLSDGTIRFHMPDGKSQDATGKAGETQITPAVVHNPENTGKTPFDAIVIELKGHKGAAASSPKAAAKSAAATKEAKK
jgi:quercetin dioxygenase-like cupin family protein